MAIINTFELSAHRGLRSNFPRGSAPDVGGVPYVYVPPRHQEPQLEYAPDLRRAPNNGTIGRPELDPMRMSDWGECSRVRYGAERNYRGRQYQRHLRHNQGEFCRTA